MIAKRITIRRTGAASAVLAIAALLVLQGCVSSVSYRADQHRTGLYSGEGPAEPPSEVWRFLTLSTLDQSPVIAGDRVFIGANDQSLYSLDLATGKRQWRFRIRENAGETVAVDNDSVFMAADDGVLYALDSSNGEERWRFTADDTPHGVIATADGVVYVGGYDDKVRALNAFDGSIVWEHDMPRSALGGVTLAEDTLYVANSDSQVTAVDAGTGEERWVTSFARGGFSTTPIAYHDGKLFVGSWSDLMAAIDAQTGEVLWTFDAEDELNAPPAVAHGLVYVNNRNGLFALDEQTGELRWTLEEPVFPAVAVTAERLYAACGSHQICMLDPLTGEMQWRSEPVSDSSIHSITVHGNQLLVTVFDGYLFLLE